MKKITCLCLKNVPNPQNDLFSRYALQSPQTPGPWLTSPAVARRDARLCSPQALLLLGGVALSCLALDLLFLLFYSFWLCCRHRKSEEHLNADCCCTAWCVIIATLVCRYGPAQGHRPRSLVRPASHPHTSNALPLVGECWR